MPLKAFFGDRTNTLLLDDLAADLNADRDYDDDYASDPDYSDHPSENDDNNSHVTRVIDYDDDAEFFNSQQGNTTMETKIASIKVMQIVLMNSMITMEKLQEWKPKLMKMVLMNPLITLEKLQEWKPPITMKKIMISVLTTTPMRIPTTTTTKAPTM